MLVGRAPPGPVDGAVGAYSAPPHLTGSWGKVEERGWKGETGRRERETGGEGRERGKRERVGEERGGKRYPAYVPTPTCTHNSPMLCYSLIIQLTVYNRTITRFIADDKVVYQ